MLVHSKTIEDKLTDMFSTLFTKKRKHYQLHRICDDKLRKNWRIRVHTMSKQFLTLLSLKGWKKRLMSHKNLLLKSNIHAITIR